MDKNINEAVKQLTKKAKSINFKENEVLFLLDNGFYVLNIYEKPHKSEIPYFAYLHFMPLNSKKIALFERVPIEPIESIYSKEELINIIFE